MSISGVPKTLSGNQPRAYAAAKFDWGDGGAATPRTVAAVILAAGRGSRFGGDQPKPLARLGRRTMLGHSVAAATAAGLRPIVVVVGYRADEVAAGAGTLAEIVVNPDWEQGLSGSLRAALAALMPNQSVTAAAVALADQPRIGSQAYRLLVGAHGAGADLAVATYDGRRGHPVLLGRVHWAEAMKLSGDEGARSLLEAHPVLEVPCDGTGDAADIDTPDALEALQTQV
ncbi:MAG TPA: nucleotidyltransferase family protein [Acidimicrobiia bacterium]|nr:nucleotidyltransferase family protein [Acidimicrobiia bacterium]